ncbi:OCIA domain-containing protein 1 isoform X2 [Esox lucius]|uniref:OCIA domain-containing protein 1 n=1 Tax=Esox lucius TaxID=8010 RepID=A0A3P8XGZ0_ESOLU|nr:OCIA domain-containing protein 1 isoform X2 [Esox lucius]
MSQTSMGLMDSQQEQQQQVAQGSVGVSYIPTEEERRVFQECATESFWYRSLPLTAVAMSVAQALVMKGVLAPSPRFGSLPKVAICGLFGYFGGQISYTKICEEKFKMLENSPLGDAIRQRRRPISSQFDTQNQLQSADPNQALFEQASHSVTEPHFQADSSSCPSDNSYGDPFISSLSEPAPTGAADGINTPVKKNQYGDAWDE